MSPPVSHSMLLLSLSSFECSEPALISRSAGRSIGEGAQAEPCPPISPSHGPCCNAARHADSSFLAAGGRGNTHARARTHTERGREWHLFVGCPPRESHSDLLASRGVIRQAKSASCRSGWPSSRWSAHCARWRLGHTRQCASGSSLDIPTCTPPRACVSLGARQPVRQELRDRQRDRQRGRERVAYGACIARNTASQVSSSRR